MLFARSSGWAAESSAVAHPLGPRAWKTQDAVAVTKNVPEYRLDAACAAFAPSLRLACLYAEDADLRPCARAGKRRRRLHAPAVRDGSCGSFCLPSLVLLGGQNDEDAPSSRCAARRAASLRRLRLPDALEVLLWEGRVQGGVLPSMEGVLSVALPPSLALPVATSKLRTVKDLPVFHGCEGEIRHYLPARDGSPLSVFRDRSTGEEIRSQNGEVLSEA